MLLIQLSTKRRNPQLFRNWQHVAICANPQVAEMCCFLFLATNVAADALADGTGKGFLASMEMSTAPMTSACPCSGTHHDFIARFRGFNFGKRLLGHYFILAKNVEMIPCALPLPRKTFSSHRQNCSDRERAPHTNNDAHTFHNHYMKHLHNYTRRSLVPLALPDKSVHCSKSNNA